MQNRGYNQNGGSYERGNGNYQHGYKSQGYNRNQPTEHYGEQYDEEKGEYVDTLTNQASKDPIKKDFYTEVDSVKNRSAEVNDEFMKKNQIRTIGDRVPRPVMEFDESGFPKYMNDQLKKTKGFEKPSTIQSQAWPVALQGRDIIGVAQTGSGKTLSFLLPGIVHVMAQTMIKRGDGPVILVMAPTRELAVQIEEQCKTFANISQLKSMCAYGGVPRYEQKQKLRQGVEILIATPGRLLDFLESRDTNLRRCTYLVLDEADRMLDMGFEKDIKKIVSMITTRDRQTLMFSATWPKEIQNLAKQFCNNAPVQINIGREDGAGTGAIANIDITQRVCCMENNYKKYEELGNFLEKVTKNNTEPQKIIIFCATKIGVDTLEKSLRFDQNLVNRVRYEAKGIHGDKLQQQRDTVFKTFKIPMEDFYFETRVLTDGQMKPQKYFKTNIMIATDVASRGLDVKDIGVVINYDMPNTIEDYVHRIGRTGRAGAKGQSYSFITQKEAGMANDLIKILNQCKQIVPPELFDLKRSGFQNKMSKRSFKPQQRMKGFNSQAVKSQRFDDDHYPSNGQPQRINFGNNNNYDDKRKSQNYDVSGGNINKRDNKYEQKDYNPAW